MNFTNHLFAYAILTVQYWCPDRQHLDLVCSNVFGFRAESVKDDEYKQRVCGEQERGSPDRVQRFTI
jgi:hypothetical protein